MFFITKKIIFYYFDSFDNFYLTKKPSLIFGYNPCFSPPCNYFFLIIFHYEIFVLFQFLFLSIQFLFFYCKFSFYFCEIFFFNFFFFFFLLFLPPLYLSCNLSVLKLMIILCWTVSEKDMKFNKLFAINIIPIYEEFFFCRINRNRL